MRLATLEGVLQARGMHVQRHGDADVRDVCRDSRRAADGVLFAALPGERRDGTAFVKMAAERGASAVLVGEANAHETNLPRLVTPDPRRAMAYLAHAVHGEPTRALRAVGITGTNGKTSTSFLVEALLRAAGAKTALLGTVTQRILDQDRPTLFTTPESDDLARFAAEARDAGADHLVMEASSHGLALHRVTGVHFDVAAFTNLSQDHLDFHPSMEAYGEAKASLFVGELAPRMSVVHVDDPFGAALAARIDGAALLRVGEGGGVDLGWRDARFSATGIEATLHTPLGEVAVRTPLIGRHNLENIVVALGVVYACGVRGEGWARACAALSSDAIATPGRMERAEGPDGVAVLVDYAHTPDALERAVAAVREVTEGRTIVVFGCGGDRDRTKRAPMGRAASAADIAIVTSDNPRSEDPAAIVDAIVVGLEAGGRSIVPDQSTEPYALRIVDRREAINKALSLAKAGDSVLIAGKGHETYQIIGDERRPFDDRQVVAEWRAN